MSSKNLHSNHLVNESSVYLLQHAHNPVNWYPWGQEALERSVKEDKPILLSIGYAACHWCHVMERESFENEAVAAIMNEHFINIKVDREERPDIDHIYMDAVQAMTGSGGWPLNVFLTPTLKPFYGGTYFPPINAHNRLSWKEVLTRVSYAYHEKKEEIEQQADTLTNHLISSNSFGLDLNNTEDDIFTEATLQVIANNIIKNADTEWGGFGKAPKFPQTFCIQYLLRHYHYSKDEKALNMATLALNKMIYGGIYDQVGGGFSRYSTDTMWKVPHFEKMLYDNALLLNVLAEAYQITQNELYARTIRSTIDFLKRELYNHEGGFYSALDADSEGVEGKFYVWTKDEIESILGEDAALFCLFFQVTEEGNWEEANILWYLNSIEEFAEEQGLEKTFVYTVIEKGIEQLLIKRGERVRPQLDDKILLNWNALMITGLCKSFEALQDVTFKTLAIDCINFIEKQFTTENNGLYHSYKNGVSKIDAFLDDYAYLIQAYISLNNITGNTAYLNRAINLVKEVDVRFKEEESGLYYYTSIGQEDIIVRKKEIYDGATPSGNAIMMNNLLFLSTMLEGEDYKESVKKNVVSLKKAIINYPSSFGIWAINVQLIIKDIKEINVKSDDYENDIACISNWFIPEKIIINKGVNTIQTRVSNDIVENASNPYQQRVLTMCTKYTCSMIFVNLIDFYNYLTKA